MSDIDGQPFALQGDSGAMVTDATGRLVGILVAMQQAVGDPSALAFAIPISEVINELAIELIGAAWHH